MSGGLGTASVELAALRARLDVAFGLLPRRALDRSDLVSAAVLVPITDRGEPHLLFAKKTTSVPHHRGQFSFPGGAVEHGDASRVQTALREAWEEIGLPSSAVEILGLLDDTETRASPFVITPVVGIVSGRVEFVPDGHEIERVLEVPLSVLRDPAVFHTEMWNRNGQLHPVHFYRVSAEDVIWGATARIVNQFLGLLETGLGVS